MAKKDESFINMIICSYNDKPILDEQIDELRALVDSMRRKIMSHFVN